jgi:hypothetical protein
LQLTVHIPPGQLLPRRQDSSHWDFSSQAPPTTRLPEPSSSSPQAATKSAAQSAAQPFAKARLTIQASENGF